MPPARVEQVAGSKNIEDPKESIVMCSALAAHHETKPNAAWVPPPITHDFTYPSDEEIVPNPRANFSKTFLPQLDQVHPRFSSEGSRRSTSCSQEATRASAPCLPIGTGEVSLSDRGKALQSDVSPRRYIDITTRLPHDQSELLQVASRPGANTRMKAIAIKNVETTPSQARKDLEDHVEVEDLDELESTSSSSLEVNLDLPRYNELNPSLPSDGEGYPNNFDSAPAHVTAEGDPRQHARQHAPRGENPSIGNIASTSRQPLSLEEQVQEQRQVVDQLAAKLDRFIDIMTGPDPNQNQNHDALVIEDPQIEEEEAIAHHPTQTHDVQRRSTSSVRP